MTSTKSIAGVTIHYRPDVQHCTIQRGTPIDLYIAQEVITSDCYGLRKLAASGFRPATVLDLGANIGTFGAFAHHLWQAKVWAVEMIAEYVPLIALNVPGVQTLTAFAGSIPKWEQLPHIVQLAEHVPVLSLEGIFKDFGLTSLDLLKLDIEGSECALFDSSAVIKAVKVFVGEWHGIDALEAVTRACVGTHYLTLRQPNPKWEQGIFTAIRMAP